MPGLTRDDRSRPILLFMVFFLNIYVLFIPMLHFLLSIDVFNGSFIILNVCFYSARDGFLSFICSGVKNMKNECIKPSIYNLCKNT